MGMRYINLFPLFIFTFSLLLGGCGGTDSSAFWSGEKPGEDQVEANMAFTLCECSYEVVKAAGKEKILEELDEIQAAIGKVKKNALSEEDFDKQFPDLWGRINVVKNLNYKPCRKKIEEMVNESGKTPKGMGKDVRDLYEANCPYTALGPIREDLREMALDK